MSGRDFERRRAKMLHKETAQLARTQPKPFSQFFYAAIVQSTLQNQPKGAGHHCRSTEPSWSTRRCLRLAPLTGPEANRLGACGT
jgi:hypothetical protein